MQGQRPRSVRWRFGLVAVLLGGLCGLTLLLQASSRAGAPPFEPRILAVHQGRQLQIAVALLGAGTERLSGPLTVALIGPEKRPLDTQRITLDRVDPLAAHAVEFKTDAKLDAKDVTVRVTFAGKSAEIPLARALLAKGHETAVVAGQDFHVGSRASLFCGVHGVRSLSETIGLPGSTIQVHLRDKAGKSHELYKGMTGRDGRADVAFEVPTLPAGSYTLEIETRSPLGSEKLQRQVRLLADTKIMLVSDKPVYQPGQLMHLRALVLQPFDLRPVAGKELLFEVEDPKGNKVFKKTLTTSEYGVASLDFQLADEVNMGDYHLRAALGVARAEKTVQVKRYVLPKFKVQLSADKSFYLPRETVKLELQSDYFFGKPVANAQVEVTANTFDVAFRKFHTWKGTTDAAGHAKLEIKLPDYFVGQPLQQGNALVKFDVKIHDSADHTETIVKSYTVSDQALRVNLIPAGGKIVPEMANRVFAAVTYPDGSPAANCEVQLWHIQLPAAAPGFGGPMFPGGAPMPGGFGGGFGGPVGPGRVGKAVGQPPAPAQAQVKQPKGKPFVTLKTNAAGLAELNVTPKTEQLRAADWGLRDLEMLGGKQQRWGPRIVFDLYAKAKDARGNTATSVASLNSQPAGENVLLRLDKAVYRTGDRMTIDVHSSAGLPTAFVDIVRGGQIMLSRWLDVKDGQASQKLDLPPNVFGSLVVHAYQMLQTGEIIRDSRVVYVQPRNELKIEVLPVKAEHEPGEDGRIRFRVTDSAGNPTQAALGVIVVDEAVYALQDLQPGLEKVYFTLQEELLKPQVQIKYSPGETIDQMVRDPIPLPAPRQQVAEVLLTAVKLPPPAQWQVDPMLERRRRVEGQFSQIAWALWTAGHENIPVLHLAKKSGTLEFAPDALDRLVKLRRLAPEQIKGVFGATLEPNDMSTIEKGFTAEALGAMLTRNELSNLSNWVTQEMNQNRARWFKDKQWQPTKELLALVVKKYANGAAHWTTDAWGRPYRVIARPQGEQNPTRQPMWDHYQLASAGPDGKFGTKDDITTTEVLTTPNPAWWGGAWWLPAERRAAAERDFQLGRGGRFQPELRRNMLFTNQGMGMMGGGGMLPMAPAMGGGFGGMPPGMPGGMPKAVPDFAGPRGGGKGGATQGQGHGGAAPVTRVREYFPETMLWQPQLVTDEKGIADLAVSFADSITTWRLSASANARAGALGGTTVPLKVFQDFFVDIDLPVSLTRGDEIDFPVAVYNYLKTPQTVRIQLQQEPWFELRDAGGLTRRLDLKPNEVTSVRFRIKADAIGFQPLTVKALGSKKSDAVKRVVEVVPNGQRFEKVVTDRLNGSIKQTITLPENALPEASKLFVRVYPGVMAQVIEGLDGMLRMPTGCFEQTSSSAYPNIMIVDYIRKNKIASPQMLMKAEQYLNVGYQRLLTFERPGGGFDWWGREEPLIWLSAYGLQEFNDMARVYPIDRGIIDRTQAFLMKKRDADGTWSKIGATHGETIERMGDPKLLLTSYVTWSLLESGYDRNQLKVSVEYIRKNLGAAGQSAYILALASNALAAYDPKDDSTLEAVRKLNQLRKAVPDWKAIQFPAGGTSLAYSHGDGATIEATALAALAMIRTGQFASDTNQALAYLVKMKQGNGTWGSTQATILALRALLAGMGGQAPKEPIHFTIKVNGKEAFRSKVDRDNADVMQAFEVKDFRRAGANDIEIDVKGETNLMYQIVGRHYEPWKVKPPVKSPIEVDVSYDRTKLSTSDVLKAKATLKYHGEVPTYMVMLDLGIAPGFTVDAGDFAEMVGKGQVKRFSVTARQVTLYLGDVKPGDVLTFEYTLRPRYPLRARTAPSVAYEYNTPRIRAEARPTELVVEERK